jgi:hypothetical protein
MRLCPLLVLSVPGGCQPVDPVPPELRAGIASSQETPARSHSIRISSSDGRPPAIHQISLDQSGVLASPAPARGPRARPRRVPPPGHPRHRESGDNRQQDALPPIRIGHDPDSPRSCARPHQNFVPQVDAFGSLSLPVPPKYVGNRAVVADDRGLADTTPGARSMNTRSRSPRRDGISMHR